MHTHTHTHLVKLWVVHGLKAYIINLGVGEVVTRGGDADVDLAGQVGELWVTLAKVGDHVLDVLQGTHRVRVWLELKKTTSHEGRLVSSGLPLPKLVIMSWMFRRQATHRA